MTCIDLMSKHQNNEKLQKWSNYNELHRFDVITIKNVELRRKTFKTTQNYKSNQITMNLHRFDVKTIKNLELRRKTLKTTKVIKIQLLASIWRRKDQKLRFVAKHSKQHKTTKVIKLRWICIDLTSKRSKMLSYVAKHSKQRKTTKVIKLQWLASIRRRKKCRVKSQNIQNNAKLQKWSNYDEFPSIWRQNDKNVELRRKTFKTTLNYKSNQITMTCIDLMSKHQNNSKLQKRSNYNELHRFDVITIKNVELRRKTFKTTQNYKSDHITMNLHRFHVKTIKTTQNYKNDQITMNCIDLTS